ncbi:YafY family protein [Saccharibacillus sacchari]|uniref:YafY family protein n=1 Tax=Saccharibacillus sacchari TaxID=456493 RepID=A0ACC6PDF6_9BACL
MNKTDRLLALILELQRQHTIRAEDLAASFEVSVRTIYRDVQALSEAGVPIVGTTGNGYSLMEGYFLPPISFTVEEAATLLIGTSFIDRQFDDAYRDRASAAGKKIEALLSDNVRSETSRIRGSMRLLDPYDQKALPHEKENLRQIRQAFSEGRKISFDYSKKNADSADSDPGRRTVAPYGLVFVEGAWMLVAFCDLRRDIRHFRLSRMKELTRLDERYELPAQFDLRAYIPADDRRLRIVLRFQPTVADEVGKSGYPYMEETHEVPSGLDVVLRVRRPDEVLRWVLGWGADVTVLEPKSFRERIREEAQKMLERY